MKEQNGRTRDRSQKGSIIEALKEHGESITRNLGLTYPRIRYGSYSNIMLDIISLRLGDAWYILGDRS